jgi:hypothetical protein
MRMLDYRAVQEILQRRNPYKWNQAQPHRTVTYEHEAKEICHTLRDMPQLPSGLASVADVIAATLFAWGCQEWVLGDYRDIAAEIYELLSKPELAAA